MASRTVVTAARKAEPTIAGDAGRGTAATARLSVSSLTSTVSATMPSGAMLTVSAHPTSSASA